MGAVEAAFGRHGQQAPPSGPVSPECCAPLKKGKKDKHHDKHHRHSDKHEGLEATEAGCPCPPPRPHGKKGRHGKAYGALDHRPPTAPKFCKPEFDLQSTSTVFDFSTEEFKRASLFVGSGFPDNGKIFFS